MNDIGTFSDVKGDAVQKKMDNGTVVSTEQSSQLDMRSILDRIQNLEKERASLKAELMSKDVKLEKLTESKRSEMQQVLDSVIKKWLESIETKV